MTPEQKTETLEDAAARIAKRFDVYFVYTVPEQSVLYKDVFSALRNERERCAKIAEVIPDSKFDLDHEPARTEQQIRNGIAATIREGR